MLSRLHPFRLPEGLEDSYRQSCLRTDILQSRIGMLLFMAPIAFLVIGDLRTLGQFPLSYWVFATRIGVAACFLTGFAFLGMVKDYRTYDLIMIVSALAFMGGSGLINIFHPPEFFFHITIVSIGIFMVYLVLPNRFINQILLALALTVGDIVITLATNYGSLSTLLTVYLNYTLANVIAFLSAWQVHSYRRRSYQEFINNKKAQAALEQQTKNLEQLVAERTEKLKNAERLAAIGATAGMVGHDIRNPLTAITGAIYMANKRLKSLPDSPEKVSLKENLDLISDETLYVNKIVADLQDYARPLDPEIGATNLGELLGSVFVSLKVPENVRVERLIELNFPSLKTDSSYLRRIIANLCNNALQAMPDGGSLTVKATCSSDTVQISVADTGFGIPEKARDKLFTPLFTTKSKGQGFGLAVVKRMVEALGGNVTFETELGKGTTFHVALPR